jgi:hypothetical protein
VIIELCHADAEPEVIRLVICDRRAIWSVGGYLEVAETTKDIKRHQTQALNQVISGHIRRCHFLQ